jgi:hypothetical protein
MFILRGTGLAVTSICKGREKGEPHENQFVIVGNPASFNPDNALDSHFCSRFGISSALERYRMSVVIVDSQLQVHTWIRVADASGMSYLKRRTEEAIQ